MGVKLGEWKEAKHLSRRVRELSRNKTSLTETIEIIESEFNVKYSPAEIRAIESGKGIGKEHS